MIMRGELIPVWQKTWAHLWVPLGRRAKGLGHPDVFGQLYREINHILVVPKSAQELAGITASPFVAQREFRRMKPNQLSGETAVLTFFEGIFEALEEFGGGELANAYFVLLEQFLATFSLRYDLRRPCKLCPTLPGVFASLVCDLRGVTSQDAHLDSLMKEFENAMRDLRMDCSDGRIKICIQKQMNLLEGIGRCCPGVTGTTLGAICNQITPWPHEKLRESMKNLYGFASDYPGIRHGGTPENAIRSIDMRELVVMSILMAGFTPYLTSQIDANVVYHRR